MPQVSDLQERLVRLTGLWVLAAGSLAHERDERPGPRRVAGSLDVGQVGVRDQPEDHRVELVDLAAERPREPDLVDRLDAGVVHQEPNAGVERGLRELDRPDVVLGDGDPRPALG
jgi:hypothetical protein